MTLNLIENGDLPDADPVMENYYEALSLIGKGHIRNLIEGSVSYANDMSDGWGEAYTDINGRNNSVNQTPSVTTSVFITPGDSVTDGGTAQYAHGIVYSQTGTNTAADTTSPDNFFDDDITTYAYCNTDRADNSFASYIGRTFSSQYVSYARVKMYLWSYDSSSSVEEVDARLESYDGASWSTVYTFPVGSSGDAEVINFDGCVLVDDTVLGLRIAYNVHNGDASPSSSPTSSDGCCGIFYTLAWGNKTTTGSEISHTIPTGTFNTSISTAFLTTLIDYYEASINIQYKLKNSGGDDTDWLETDVVSEFTAFTAEPDELIVRLVPSSSSPTLGYPSIKGCWVRAT